MVKKLLLVGLAGLMFGPAIILLGVGLLVNPAANASCTTSTVVNVGDIPGSLAVATADGTALVLDSKQLGHAAIIIDTGMGIDGVGRDGARIALMAALTESSLRQLSNITGYPESANYPNDGDGSDHDSLGLFQMRPQAGWGTVADLMDPHYQARAFFGGPAGPNYPSPRGLLDIPGWQQMDPGEAAQAVEVSAYPNRYRTYQPAADTILAALTGGLPTGGALPDGCRTAAVFFPNTGIDPPQRAVDGSWPAESCAVPDPTQPGRDGACVTGRTTLLVEQIRAMQVGDGGIACWDPHEWNPTSDHPQGRACDIVFGALGHFPAGADKDNGERLAAWLTGNADTWAIAYVIWQGQIWTVSSGSWAAYTGAGIYDPADPTGGHYDHIHVSVR